MLPQDKGKHNYLIVLPLQLLCSLSISKESDGREEL